MSTTRAIVLLVLSVLIYEVELGHTFLHGQVFVLGCISTAVMLFLTFHRSSRLISGALGQSLSWVQVCVITEGGLSGGRRREVRDTGLETEGADKAYDFRGNHKELRMGSLFFSSHSVGS